jgi:drug/metabolite transporter (DMT)-like permease
LNAAGFIRLLLLAAIWGSSFLFMRIGVPSLGPVWLVTARVALAALFLWGVALVMRKPLNVRRHWRHYLIIGFFNSALPFLLYGIAAQRLSASLLAILNATSPIWSALIAALWLRHKLCTQTACGMALGLLGVVVLVGLEPIDFTPVVLGAVVCAVAAATSYGIATNYTQASKQAKNVDTFSNAHGTMWAATLWLVPAVPFFPMTVEPSWTVLLAVLALGVVCSGVAYLLYFRLITEVGAAPALTVTFLIPVFGILWGHLFLGEPVNWQMGLGAGIVLCGTALATGFSPRAIWRKRHKQKAD